MATRTDFDYTDDMASNKQPFLTDFRASLNSIEDEINVIGDDGVQVANDSFGTAYGLNGDKTQNFSNSSLYNPIYAKSSYTGGNIAIAATGAWTDVDTNNLAISITPENLTSDIRCIFQFSLQSVTTNATNETDVRFRLTDGSTISDAEPVVKLVTGVNATTNVVPVTLDHLFDTLSGNTAVTFKLQYYITTSTNTTITVLANTNAPAGMQAIKS